MPPMIVRKTIGPISTRNNAMNPVPIGSIALPKPGASQPTRMPAMIATITQKYSCRYHLGFATGSALAIRSTAVVLAIVPTSLSGACTEGPPGMIDKLWADGDVAGGTGSGKGFQATAGVRPGDCEVRGDDHGEVLGLEHELRGHRIDEHALVADVRVVLRHAGEGLVPQHHAVLLGVA